jgi:hypothetical protein
MQAETIDEKTLRRYLLGDVSPEEREVLELWLMSEDDAYDLLVAAEDDLIDDSLRSKLNRAELKRFNAHFLVADERQRKLDFGRTFNRYVELIKRQRLQNTSGKPSQRFSITIPRLATRFLRYSSLSCS